MKLTQEQKQILIAEACGWKKQYSEARGEYRWHAPDFFNFSSPPDYFGDLNACHEMENAVISGADGQTKRLYSENLSRLATLGGTSGECATAAQRAEAFGLTLNLWTPEP